MRLLIARGRGSGRASIRARTARSYLQFSFVNNKPWRRRGSDFNEGINNPGCGREARLAEGTAVERDNGKRYTAAGERAESEAKFVAGVAWQESRDRDRSVSRFYDAGSPRLGKRARARGRACETLGISRAESPGFNSPWPRTGTEFMRSFSPRGILHVEAH